MLTPGAATGIVFQPQFENDPKFPLESIAATGTAPAVVQENSSSSTLATAKELGSLQGDQNVSIQARYLYGLRKLIESRKVYPALARRNGETGRVVIGLLVHRGGEIEKLTIRQASSSDRLNQAALEAVSGIKRYEPFPEAISSASLEVEVPIEYSL